MVNIKGHEIPNLASELTVEQFDYLNSLSRNNQLDNIDKWVSKFIYLGVPEEVFEDVYLDELKEYIRLFNDSELTLEKVTEIEVDGYTYVAPERIGVKDLGLIEKAWKLNIDTFGSEAMAILFKRSDLTKKEHYTNAHLKHKQKIFKGLKSNIAVPYVYEILKELNNTAEKLNNESQTTEELDGSNG